ncbi:sensor domain-containing diguanylate cyclase [Brevibacillus ginsengisoli]|uniref:sensor domain-containing diguanylate cyclase n=1 Tax=Brevibacillus ginsengisoli TaxID=363854 RepID=UPI003CF449F0
MINLNQRAAAEASKVERRDIPCNLPSIEEFMQGTLEATSKLVIHSDVHEAVSKALDILGTTMRVDSICIFENDNHPDPVQILANLRYTWQKHLSSPPLSHFNYNDAGLMRWFETLSNHTVIHSLVEDLPNCEQAFLHSQGIVSILIAPFAVQGKWRGFIGFFDCKLNRQWSPMELNALKTVATAIGGAFHRMREESQLQQSSEECRTLTTALTFISTGVVITNPRLPDNPIIFVNQAFTKLTGYTEDEVKYRNPRFLNGKRTDPDTLRQIREAITERKSIKTELCNYTKNGTLFWNEIDISPILNEQGEALYYVGLLSDITERRQKIEQLNLYAKVVENTQQGVIITDKLAKIIWGNEAFSLTTGYTLEEVMGRNPRIFQSGLHHGSFYKTMWQTIQQTGQWQGEIWNRRKNGEAYAEWLNITRIQGEEGEVTNYVAVFSDITERKRFEQELREANEKLRLLSSVDGLTEIANRRFFDELYQREWTRAMRNSLPLSLIMIDIDYFKAFNDTYGHQEGDECLKLVAQTLAATIKRSNDLVARYGGEEFVIILPQTDLEGAATVARKLREQIQALRITHMYSKSSQYVSISLGVACTHPALSSHPEELIRMADQALYRAKREGGNRVTLMKM